MSLIVCLHIFIIMGMCVSCKHITCLYNSSIHPEENNNINSINHTVNPKLPIDNNNNSSNNNNINDNNNNNLMQIKSSSLLTREPSSSMQQNNNNNSNQHVSCVSPSTSNNTKSFVSNYEILMLNEINSVRLNPKNYSLKLKNLIPMITNNNANQDKTFLIYDEDIKIELKKGVSAFQTCIDYLNSSNLITLEPIEFISTLKIPFPNEDTSLCLDKAYISKHIEQIRNKVKHKYEIYDFQYDISPNPVLSTIIQVVDDTNSNLQRRNNILSDVIKYVGISYGEIKKGIYCFYLLFAY